MTAAGQRDVRAVLSAWASTTVENVERPTTGGYSNDTFFFTANGNELVARFPPVGPGLFPTHDLAEQAAVMRALRGIIPVPEVVAYVDDPPFLVMRKVNGLLATDNPPYLLKGWLHDAPPADQRRVQDAFLDLCARIHRAPIPDIGLREGLGADIAWWREYLAWINADDALVARFDALVTTAPAETAPPSLCWGDMRIPNVVFDTDLAPTAVLDWEGASIAPAELDVGWYLAIHRKSLPKSGNDLPGFRGREDALAFYEACLGRELHALDWYEAWADLRIDLIMSRMFGLLAT